MSARCRSSVSSAVGGRTGGGLLAPIAAKLLGVESVRTMRVSRYGEDIYSPLGLAQVAISRLCGTHDQQYTVSAAATLSTRGKPRQR